MGGHGFRRARKTVLSLALLLSIAAVGYLASLPIDERSCALRWTDGLTARECVLRMHE